MANNPFDFFPTSPEPTDRTFWSAQIRGASSSSAPTLPPHAPSSPAAPTSSLVCEDWTGARRELQMPMINAFERPIRHEDSSNRSVSRATSPPIGGEAAAARSLPRHIPRHSHYRPPTVETIPEESPQHNLDIIPPSGPPNSSFWATHSYSELRAAASSLPPVFEDSESEGEAASEVKTGLNFDRRPASPSSPTRFGSLLSSGFCISTSPPTSPDPTKSITPRRASFSARTPRLQPTETTPLLLPPVEEEDEEDEEEEEEQAGRTTHYHNNTMNLPSPPANWTRYARELHAYNPPPAPPIINFNFQRCIFCINRDSGFPRPLAQMNAMVQRQLHEGSPLPEDLVGFPIGPCEACYVGGARAIRNLRSYGVGAEEQGGGFGYNAWKARQRIIREYSLMWAWRAVVLGIAVMCLVLTLTLKKG